ALGVRRSRSKLPVLTSNSSHGRSHAPRTAGTPSRAALRRACPNSSESLKPGSDPGSRDSYAMPDAFHLPIRRITFYRHGLAMVEREGRVDGGLLAIDLR